MNAVEVAVVGAGPGGLAAAVAAAERGAQVTVIDSGRQPGGQYYRVPGDGVPGDGVPVHAPRREAGQRLVARAAAAGVRFLSGATVWGAFPGNLLALSSADGPRALQAQLVILATGAYDRPVAFPGWTLPGVLTAGAAQALLVETGTLPGKRIVLAGSGPLQITLAAELLRTGAQLVGLFEGQSLPAVLPFLRALLNQRARVAEGMAALRTLARHGVVPQTGWGIVAAEGGEEVEQVTVARLDAEWRLIPGSERTLACDTLLVGYGFVPSSTLARLLGAAHAYRPEWGGEVPVRDARCRTTAPGVYAVGDGAGIGGAPLALLEGELAGIDAAAQTGHGQATADAAIAALAPALARERRFMQTYAALFTPGPGLAERARDDTILCRCEDITQAEVRHALELGADSAAEVKSITRAGMGNCQGRICGRLLAELVARERGLPVTEADLWAPRPPIFPVPVSHLDPVWAVAPKEVAQ